MKTNSKSGFGRFFACVLIGACIVMGPTIARAAVDTKQVVNNSKVINVAAIENTVPLTQTDQLAGALATTNFQKADTNYQCPATIALQKVDGAAAINAIPIAAKDNFNAVNPACSTAAPNFAGATAVPPTSLTAINNLRASPTTDNGANINKAGAVTINDSAGATFTGAPNNFAGVLNAPNAVDLAATTDPAALKVIFRC